MKKTFLCLLMILVAGAPALMAQQKKTDATKDQAPLFTSTLDTVSYIVGTDVAFTLLNNQMELNPEIFAKGFIDAWRGLDSMLTIEQAEEIMVRYGSEMQARRQKELEENDVRAVAAGKSYMEENKMKQGVITTESGLQYEVLRQGDGAKPASTDRVTVHYKGSLINGSVFDSSYDRGEPATFELNRLIPGWTEGIQLMQAGSKFRFVVPPQLGYGNRDMGVIPPNSTLVFEVELLDIE
jgi:FKBP-type peptidyl-prolyl cis-trans isomerase FkpA